MFVELCKECFKTQPFQTSPLCSSTTLLSHIFTNYFSTLLSFLFHSSSLLKEGEKTSKLAKVQVEAILGVYLYLHPNYDLILFFLIVTFRCRVESLWYLFLYFWHENVCLNLVWKIWDCCSFCNGTYSS
jgi:hypothetical protein